jgi:hypothetical protein
MMAHDPRKKRAFFWSAAVASGTLLAVIGIIALRSRDQGEHPPPHPPLTMERVVIPAGMSIRTMVTALSESRGHTSHFLNCAHQWLDTPLREGEVTGKDLLSIFRQLPSRVPPPGPFFYWDVEERDGTYEITCGK